MENYSSATGPVFKEKVDKAILEEIEAGNYVAVDSKPSIVSALGAVPKPDSDDIRLIHDCSMPPGKGVNSYISVEKQSFQSLNDATKLIGKGYFIAKVDLRRAYRSVPVHPANFKALGLKWKLPGDDHFTYFVDTRLPFGGSSAPGIFHRLTQSVRRMMARRGFSDVVVYLDDFLVVGRTYEESEAAYMTLRSLLLELGFTISPSKLVTPCQKLVFLGVEIDTIKLTLSLSVKKLSDLKDLLQSFRSRVKATKRQLQQLAGRLNWACKVVFGGRTFLRRILDLMNTLPRQSAKCRLGEEFWKDIDWWLQFLEVFNGFSHFHDPRPVVDLHTDACSTGVGAEFQGDWFYSNLLVDYPAFSGSHINYKEALCVVLALKRWAPLLRNKVVHIHCDNTAAVAMLNKGTTKDPDMMSHLREAFWLSAIFNFSIRVFHVPGKLNVLADHISRLHMPFHLQAFAQHLLNWARHHVFAPERCSVLSSGYISPQHTQGLSYSP
ncbi:uncharacterized protein [Clytia hemisphaerica]|uniref:uncharacterized protein n=1 Tax=Clytia hemisphaerica TaxID=252671 RepID=UPI0034D69FC9